MWSQYGEDHQGVCLVISQKRILQELINKLNTEEYIILFKKIDYKEPSHKKAIDLNSSDYCDDMIRIVLEHIKNNQNPLLFTKYLDYRDENEFRIIVINKNIYDNRANVIILDIKKIIEGLILGDKFHECYKPTIKKLINGLGLSIPIRKVHWENGYYLLENWIDR